MSKKINILGKKFNRALVIEEVITTNGRGPKWKCICDCGKDFVVNSSYVLISGHTKSCGCLAKEIASKRFKELNSKKSKYGSPRLSTAHKIYNNRYADGDLTFEQFLEMSQKNCRWCGNEPSNSQKIFDKNTSSQYYIDNCEFIYNGLDRRDNNIKEHNFDNLDPCCKICNYAKRERSVDNFKEWVLRLGDNLIEKGLIFNQSLFKITIKLN